MAEPVSEKPIADIETPARAGRLMFATDAEFNA
jgi:hypothetical protein